MRLKSGGGCFLKVTTGRRRVKLLEPLGIKELIRAGRIAIAREATRTASPRREPALLKS